MNNIFIQTIYICLKLREKHTAAQMLTLREAMITGREQF